MDQRIAIVGSFSTGKTTVATRLATELGLPLLPEVAREVAALGFELDKNATPELETLIFLRQLRNEQTHAAFVGDRSLIDVMTYASWVMDNQTWRKETALWETCVDIAHLNLRSQYSHVYYLPIEFPIMLDGLRPDDPAFQADIDTRLVKILTSFDIPFVEISGSVDERIEKIHADLVARNVVA